MPDLPTPPPAASEDCPVCHRLMVQLTPARRFGAHRELLRPSKQCKASGLLPADLA
jgi:hypothetical protein